MTTTPTTKRYECTMPDGNGGTYTDLVDAVSASAARAQKVRVLQDVSSLSFIQLARQIRVRRSADPTKAEVARAKLEADLIYWNARYPVGTLVRYWRMDRVGEPSGTGKTRSRALALGGHTAVVWIEGCSGSIHLTHVEALDPPRPVDGYNAQA